MIIEMHIMQLVIVTVVPVIVSAIVAYALGNSKGYEEGLEDKNLVGGIINDLEKAREKELKMYRKIISN